MKNYFFWMLSLLYSVSVFPAQQQLTLQRPSIANFDARTALSWAGRQVQNPRVIVPALLAAGATVFGAYKYAQYISGKGLSEEKKKLWDEIITLSGQIQNPPVSRMELFGLRGQLGKLSDEQVQRGQEIVRLGRNEDHQDLPDFFDDVDPSNSNMYFYFYNSSTSFNPEERVSNPSYAQLRMIYAQLHMIIETGNSDFNANFNLLLEYQPTEEEKKAISLFRYYLLRDATLNQEEKKLFNFLKQQAVENLDLISEEERRRITNSIALRIAIHVAVNPSFVTILDDHDWSIALLLPQKYKFWGVNESGIGKNSIGQIISTIHHYNNENSKKRTFIEAVELYKQIESLLENRVKSVRTREIGEFSGD